MHVVTATAERDTSLLQLLEENAMHGDIDLAMTRRPHYFSTQDDFGIVHSALALEGERAVGMCRLTEHAGFANGERQPLGYLGGLRITPSYRHRIRVLRAGFQHLRQLPPPIRCYTSIAADNHEARRLLERGVAGLPVYRYLGEMCSLAISRRRGRRHNLWRVMPEERYDNVVEYYHRHASRRQLAPVLNAQWLRNTGATVLGCEDEHSLKACAVLWDQQAFKQVLAARYSRRVRLLRPLYNGYARVTGRVTLPAAGQTLDHCFLAFFAADDKEQLTSLVEDALTWCTTQVLSLGLPAGFPETETLINDTRAMVYRTRLYGVDLIAQPEWEHRIVWPEIALL
ncbi:N-acetyltransferase [Citrobacter amalonaticus]|uniref:N-acetyltransferase n=1 Tax=Citrobacter amalonaticus TaxID=35703 RepID=UPI00300C3CEA